jgi:hypothetical protein
LLTGSWNQRRHTKHDEGMQNEILAQWSREHPETVSAGAGNRKMKDPCSWDSDRACRGRRSRTDRRCRAKRRTHPLLCNRPGSWTGELTGARRAAKAEQKHQDAGQEPPSVVERAKQELAQQTGQGRDFRRDKSGGSYWTENQTQHRRGWRLRRQLRPGAVDETKGRNQRAEKRARARSAERESRETSYRWRTPWSKDRSRRATQTEDERARPKISIGSNAKTWTGTPAGDLDEDNLNRGRHQLPKQRDEPKLSPRCWARKTSS